MGFLSRVVVAGLVAAAATAGAALADEGDDALAKACQDELAGLPQHGETFIVAKDIQHQGDRVSVKLELASGEGRRIAGTCVFRGGRLFDVKQQG
jgi:hypothetical protein